MLTAVALPYDALPLPFVERHGLSRFAHDRGGERELRFHYNIAAPVLPVWHEGQPAIVTWGCHRGESRVLPATGWARLATVTAGDWAAWGAEPVVIPAVLGFDGGVWFAVREGIRGVLVRDDKDKMRVYPVCEPASHYYKVMTRSEWMPVLVRDRI
jgi:hypothetical protein